MRVAALSLTGLKLEQDGEYATILASLLEELRADLVVLPAYTAFLLWTRAGNLEETCEFGEGFRAFMHESGEWNEEFLHFHSQVARENHLFLVAGTTVTTTGDRFYHTAYCFGPQGEVCGQQHQTHLSREERALGLSRGEELHILDAGLKMGIIVGTDSYHPEVGRILALEGADLVAHTGALVKGVECRTQLARMWAQVQQNQFWAVEAQLSNDICNRSFAGQCGVLGPCEATTGLTGYLARTFEDEPFVVADLVEADRQEVKGDYPLLQLLQPRAYEGLLPELYGE